MPDFDIDFCQDGRDRVIDYVKDKYGATRVSQIATFGTMAAKAWCATSAACSTMSYGFVDGIAKLIPFSRASGDITRPSARARTSSSRSSKPSSRAEARTRSRAARARARSSRA
jgi:DNA polymerase III alpha subunit